MPKKLFYKISDKKQEKIFCAAFDEFSKHRYMDASINKIVENSNISRGSFYLYFEDKLDIYLFTTSKVIENQSQIFLSRSLRNKNYDMFSFFRDLFLFNINLLSDTKYSQYFKNLYLGMNYDIWSYIKDKQRTIRENAFKQLSFGDTTDIQNRYNEALTSILEMINRDMISKKVFDGISEKVILEMYDIRIELLKKGKGGIE